MDGCNDRSNPTLTPIFFFSFLSPPASTAKQRFPGWR
jgi:hypothetical protein